MIREKCQRFNDLVINETRKTLNICKRKRKIYSRKNCEIQYSNIQTVSSATIGVHIS